MAGEGESQAGANATEQRRRTEVSKAGSEQRSTTDAQAARRLHNALIELPGSKSDKLKLLAGSDTDSKTTENPAIVRYRSEAKLLRDKAMFADPAFQELQQKIFESKRFPDAVSKLEDMEPGQLAAVRNEAINAYAEKEKNMSDILDRHVQSEESYNAEFLRLTNEGVTAEKAQVLAREFARIKICTEGKTLGHKDQRGRDEMLSFYEGRKDVLGDPSYLAEFRQLTEAGATIEDARTIAFEHTKAKLAEQKGAASTQDTLRPNLSVIPGGEKDTPLSAQQQSPESNTSGEKAA